MDDPRPERLAFLDSVRGIAALLVVIYHCGLSIGANFIHDQGTLLTVDSFRGMFLYICARSMSFGRSPVIMFFVLSGFVLTHSLVSHPSPYLAYAVRRFFRIYPVFFVVILTSYALHSIIDGSQSILILMGHLAMVGTSNYIHLDGAIWSLVHEMRISLLFPFLLWCVSRFRKVSIILALVSSICCTILIRTLTGFIAIGSADLTFGATWLETVYFIFFFALGSYVALGRQTIARWIASLSILKKGLVFVIIFFCLAIGDHGNRTFYSSGIDYLRGLGSAGLIALALGIPSFSRALNHSILIWLGRISFSLYLVHMPVIYAATTTFGSSWPPILAGIAIIIMSLSIAAVFSAAIEYPCIKLGKYIVTWLKPKGMPFQQTDKVRGAILS